MLLEVRVQPRAATEGVSVRGGRLHVRVKAPPIEGRANAAVCSVVAKALGLPKRSVHLRRGASSRDKVVSIDGMDEREVKRCLGL